MTKISAWFDRWSGRMANALTFWPLLFPTGAGALIAYLSQGVTWIAALGAFGWVVSGLIGFLVVSAALSLLGRSRLYRVEAKIRERISGDSSAFDPMARVYENKRLHLRDLAPLARKRVQGKKFINCEIIGPGTVVIGLTTDPEHRPFILVQCNTHDVDCIEIDPNVKSQLAIEFWDCSFENCDFYHMTLLFTSRSNETLHWITPDFRQAIMLDDKSDEQG